MALRDDWRELVPQAPDPKQVEVRAAFKWLRFWGEPVAKQLAYIDFQCSNTRSSKGMEDALLDMRRFGLGLVAWAERCLILLDSSEKRQEDGDSWTPPRKLREMRERGEDYSI